MLHNPKNVELRYFINLQMGGLHAWNVFLAVTGKLFGLAVLKGLIVEAPLAGPD